jgi:hypothetical protein
MMSFGDEIDDGVGDRNEFLKQLVNQDEVIGASLDVTKLVIAEGEGALTGGQKDVFKLVLDAYVTEICPCHGYRIPWGEMYEFHVSGKCRWCERDDSRICAE